MNDVCTDVDTGQPTAENDLQTNILRCLPSGKKPEIGTKEIDIMPLANLPEKISTAVLSEMNSAIAEIFEQGARGPACRRLLAREIELAHTQLRVLEGWMNMLLQKAGTGQKSERLVRTLGQLIHQTHCRMMAAIDQLARLDQTTPTIRIQADQAAVLVGGSRRG